MATATHWATSWVTSVITIAPGHEADDQGKFHQTARAPRHPGEVDQGEGRDGRGELLGDEATETLDRLTLGRLAHEEDQQGEQDAGQAHDQEGRPPVLDTAGAGEW